MPGKPHVMQFSLPSRAPKQFVGTPGDSLYEDVLRGSRFEHDRHSRLYQAVHRNGVFVEVGANIGTGCIFAADFFNRCYVYEPDPTNFMHLQTNIALNGARNIVAKQVAVSDVDGAAVLFQCSERNSGGHTLVNGVIKAPARTTQVAVVTLDKDLDTITDCTMLHIDTEGNDVRVLKGARQFLNRQTLQPVIRMEYAPRWLAMAGSTFPELERIMMELKMSAFMLPFEHPYEQVDLSRLLYLWQNPRSMAHGWCDLLLVPGALINYFLEDR